MGIEADGTIKGCPSLPTGRYTGGNIRTQSLYDIVTTADELTFNLNAGTETGKDHLWGFCQSCEYADLCRGGCNWTAHVFFDKRGNNPYCHHRALVHAAQDQRETLTLKRNAFGLPFDNGEFAIQLDALQAEWPAHLARVTPDSIQWSQAWLDETPDLAQQIQAEIDANIASMQAHLKSAKAA